MTNPTLGLDLNINSQFMDNGVNCRKFWIFHGYKDFFETIIPPDTASGYFYSLENQAKQYAQTANGRSDGYDYGHYWLFDQIFQ